MYTGLTGKIIINRDAIVQNTPVVAYISNWSVEDTTDIIEVTKLGNKFKEKLPGMQSWSASADGAVEFALVDGKDSGQAELFAAKHAGTEVNCEFFLKSATKFSGKGIIESLSVDLSAEDKGNISISISGTGPLSHPDAHDAIN
jgi:predicted secreted protein